MNWKEKQAAFTKKKRYQNRFKRRKKEKTKNETFEDRKLMYCPNCLMVMQFKMHRERWQCMSCKYKTPKNVEIVGDKNEENSVDLGTG